MGNSTGNGPPRDIEPLDLWSQITTLPRAHRVVNFPRYDADGVAVGKVAICVLSSKEVNLANISSEKAVRDQYKKIVGEVPKKDEASEAYASIASVRSTGELLFRACKRADECEPDAMTGVCLVNHSKLRGFFPTVEAIGELSTDETAVLIDHYLVTQAEVGPFVSKMSSDEMNAWIEVLGKGGSQDPLVLLTSAGLRALMMYMASRLCHSQTDTSSRTPPQE